MTCPDCERHKSNAALWRHKAYELSGTPLPWSAEEVIKEAVLAERERREEVTNEDLTRMAHEAGMVPHRPFTLAHLRDFAARVAAAEREAAAMTAKESLQRLGVDWAITEAVMKDIRARGEKK